MALERTFSIIKPNAVSDSNIGNIISRFEKEELKIAAAKLVRLSKEKAEGFYAEHKDKAFFPSLITFMTSAPVMIMVLEGENAIEKNREIMGATNPEKAGVGTLRKLYAHSLEANAVHGSDSKISAAREINYFFSSEEIFSRF